MLVAAHPQYADAILAEEDEEAEVVSDEYTYDGFDEDDDHTLYVDDYAAMEEMLEALQVDGFSVTEYED